jgi:hypothetical protein
MSIARRPNRRFFEIADYLPFPIQAEIHASKADMRVVCVGRQVGKAKRVPSKRPSRWWQTREA